MDDDRFPVLLCDLNLGPEGPGLKVVRLFVPVVVETDLADRDDFWIIYVNFKFFDHLIREIPDLVRMQADRPVDKIIPLCQDDDLIKAFRRRADINDPPDSGLRERLKQLLTVRIESLVIIVHMRINYHIRLNIVRIFLPSRYS